jgi:hypothetical protein
MYGVTSSKANWRSMGSDGVGLILQMRRSPMNGFSSSCLMSAKIGVRMDVVTHKVGGCGGERLWPRVSNTQTKHARGDTTLLRAAYISFPSWILK